MRLASLVVMVLLAGGIMGAKKPAKGDPKADLEAQIKIIDQGILLHDPAKKAEQAVSDATLAEMKAALQGHDLVKLKQMAGDKRWEKLTDDIQARYWASIIVQAVTYLERRTCQEQLTWFDDRTTTWYTQDSACLARVVATFCSGITKTPDGGGYCKPKPGVVVPDATTIAYGDVKTPMGKAVNKCRHYDNAKRTIDSVAFEYVARIGGYIVPCAPAKPPA